MSPTPGIHSLEGFSMIGPGKYLREQGQDSDTTSPNVILIFGWMGAQLRHLQNYTHTYTKLYPNASQIVVRCNPDIIWCTISTIQRRLMPVIDALKALHCLPSSESSLEQRRPRVLSHVFSNGGCLQMTCLGHMLQQRYGSVSAQWSFTSALVLDSCPTAVDFNTLKLAFSSLFQNSIVRAIVLTFISTVYFIRFCLSLLAGKQMMLVSDTHIHMRNPRVLPWMSVHTPRLYLFSRKDKLIPWQDVTHHAKTAKEGGIDVRCELFEESEHVAHMRVEPERYWSSVQDVWMLAISREKGEKRQSQTLLAQHSRSFL